MRRALTVILGFGLGANAMWMLLSPMGWYSAVPGVAATGPANGHFIRDIGCAYLATALSLFWLVKSPKLAWPAALAGGGFLVLHALVHVSDGVAGREHAHQLLGELPTVFLPGVLVVWLAWSAKRAEKE
jgi:hypothetical protein